MKLSKELIIISLALTLLIAVSFFRQKSATQRSPQAPDVEYTSYSAGEHGTKALYMVLGKLGYEVKRLRMSHLTEMRSGGLAIALAPDQPVLDEAYAEELLDWTRSGNVLIFAPGEPDDQLAEALGIQLDQGQPSEVHIAPFELTDLSAGIKSLAVESGDRISTRRADAVQHFGDDAGGVMISLREGDGTAIVLSDPYLLTNVGLPESDNLKLLVNILLSYVGDRKTVYFDEYHHGFGRQPSVLHLLKGTSLGWALLQVAAAMILLLYSRSQRFGRPVPVFSEEHRSSLEYVTSLANIYQSAGASDTALSILYERLSRSVKYSTPKGNIEELMDDFKRKMAEGKVSEEELIALARRMKPAQHPGEGR